MILNEATNALDTRTETEVQPALQNTYGERTVFLITHRLSSLSNTDQIIVLHAGENVERGTRQQLVSLLSGSYFEL